MQGIKLGHRPCDCDDHDDPHFMLPPDAWIPSSAKHINAAAYSKIISGHNMEEMATDYKELPFAMPESAENRKKINEILRFSLKQQSEDEIFDNPSVVTLLVSRCLTAAGIQNRIAYGYRAAKPKPTAKFNENVDEYLEGKLDLWRSPQAWLVIDNHVIDNRYIKHMPANDLRYLLKNTAKCYEEISLESPFPSSSPPESDDDDSPGPLPPNQSANQVVAVRKKRVEFCMRHPDKALALGHNREQFYDYYFAMIRHMHQTYGVTVAGIDPTIRLCCWWCDKFPQKGKDHYTDTVALRQVSQSPDEPSGVSHVSSLSRSSWRLLQCGRCMVANYCSKNCQRQDWADNHWATCLNRGSVMLGGHHG